MDDIKGLTPHASRVNETVSVATIPWRFTYLCWNIPMIQKVLAQPHWQGKLTPRDYAALTPLIWDHVNPYGRFDLDMNSRLALL
jgi:Tn3 transposase DDE domain